MNRDDRFDINSSVIDNSVIDNSVTDMLGKEEAWNEFIIYKIESQHLNKTEEEQIRKYIEEKRYIPYKDMIDENIFPNEFPLKKIVNKEGCNKKRVVYSFSENISITLKFIAYQLYQFDDIFSGNCYAFRRDYGVGDALRRILRNGQLHNKYCFKTDISNYFNSIDTKTLVKKLDVIKQKDLKLYRLFEKILSEQRVWENNKVVEEQHGAMAGLPIAPFFANVYLMDLDKEYADREIDYFRYSDDILLFADTYEELEQRRDELYVKLKQRGLVINLSKESISLPGESWEFLGFSYANGRLDLSANTKRKIKAKIKRKAEALRRWQRKKKLSSDKAAIGFIKTMNRKFYGQEGEDDFNWSRWFFPYLTVDDGLKEIDRYMQEYIRYTVTGRHYKGNYRITYEQLGKWGYRSLVHEYYRRKQEKSNNKEVTGKKCQEK